MGNLYRGWKKEEYSTPDSIWELNIDYKAKYVYLYLNRCLEVEGEVFPSHATIAKYTGISKSSVRRGLELLNEHGLIEIINRKKQDSKENDTNIYILNHPDELKDIPRIGDSPKQGVVTVTSGHSEHMVTENILDIGMVTENTPKSSMSTVNVGSQRASTSVVVDNVVVGVVERCLYTQFKELWQNSFGKKISEKQIEKLVHIGREQGMDFETMKQQIKNIGKHMNPRSPFATVLTCFSEGGWSWDEEEEPRKQKEEKKQKQTRQPQYKKQDKLPKSVQKQMEQEASGQLDQQQPSKDLAEKQARIQAKLKLMHERLAKRKEVKK